VHSTRRAKFFLAIKNKRSCKTLGKRVKTSSHSGVSKQVVWANAKQLCCKHGNSTTDEGRTTERGYEYGYKKCNKCRSKFRNGHCKTFTSKLLNNVQV
jgi:hypothetical protein